MNASTTTHTALHPYHEQAWTNWVARMQEAVDSLEMNFYPEVLAEGEEPDAARSMIEGLRRVIPVPSQALWHGSWIDMDDESRWIDIRLFESAEEAVVRLSDLYSLLEATSEESDALIASLGQATPQRDEDEEILESRQDSRRIGDKDNHFWTLAVIDIANLVAMETVRNGALSPDNGWFSLHFGHIPYAHQIVAGFSYRLGDLTAQTSDGNPDAPMSYLDMEDMQSVTSQLISMHSDSMPAPDGQPRGLNDPEFREKTQDVLRDFDWWVLPAHRAAVTLSRIWDVVIVGESSIELTLRVDGGWTVAEPGLGQVHGIGGASLLSELDRRAALYDSKL